MRKVLVLLLAFLMSGLIFGQVNEPISAQQMLDTRGEVYFKFTLPDDEALKDELLILTRIISIDNVAGNVITAYANSREFGNFIKLGIDYDVLTPPSMIHKSILENASSQRNTDAWDYYPSYGEYISMMNQFVSDYPDLCELVSIGNTTNDRDLLFIHINNNLGVAQNEPEFMYTSTMHGDEVTGFVLMLRYIDYLLSNYGSDPEITYLVDNIDIWINPNANPDGTYAAGNNTVYGATRGNANDINLNRNFADPEDGPHPDGNEYQVETLAFMDFAEENDFVMSSNIHGGAEVVNYPWDTWPRLAADDDWWVLVSRQYADSAQYYSPSGYLTDLDNGITNGYAWYSISGGRQDYVNYFHNCREMTLEISGNKMPPETQLPAFWEYNYRSFNNYMKQTLYGFSGIVTNANNGNPLLAKVFIENHELDNSFVYTQMPVGNYHRPVKAGTYDVTFSAFGCYDKTIYNVQILDGADYELNVELTPFGTLSADFTASTKLSGEGSEIDFFDNSVGNNILYWEWTFEGGNPSTSNVENPQGIYYENEGEFDVTLTIESDGGFSDTKHMEDYISIKQAFNMSDEIITTCDALFFDSGSEDVNYSDNEEYTMTFFPDAPSSLVKLDFLEFNVETQANCEYDYMEIYDGIDINAPLIGKWCGTDSPGTIIAGTEVGALTVYFYSNSTITEPGWKAIVSCDSNVGIQDVSSLDITIYPNPANNDININSAGEINNIILSDMQGRVLHRGLKSTGIHSINVAGFMHGIYILSFEYRGNIITKKVMVH